MSRFVLIADSEFGGEFKADKDTCWYWDTERPGGQQDKYPYIAIQCYKDKNPNDYVRHNLMYLLFTDQAEYYAVCPVCYDIYSDMQWSGSTRSPNYANESGQYLKDHAQTKGWCEFCDPIFGNGGWVR